jgi:hypothetical protein
MALRLRSQALALDLVPWSAILVLRAKRKGKAAEETQFVMEDIEEATEEDYFSPTDWQVPCLEAWIDEHHFSIFTVHTGTMADIITIGVTDMAAKGLGANWIAARFTRLMDELGQSSNILTLTEETESKV